MNADGTKSASADGVRDAFADVLRDAPARGADTGDLLVSRFTTKPADTPERAQQLHAMPPLKLVRSRRTATSSTAMPTRTAVTACTSVTSRRTAEYERLALQKQIADERLEAAEAEEGASWTGASGTVAVKGFQGISGNSHDDRIRRRPPAAPTRWWPRPAGCTHRHHRRYFLWRRKPPQYDEGGRCGRTRLRPSPHPCLVLRQVLHEPFDALGAGRAGQHRVDRQPVPAVASATPRARAICAVLSRRSGPSPPGCSLPIRWNEDDPAQFLPEHLRQVEPAQPGPAEYI